MASRVVMPKLTDTMEEGVVLKWKKEEGDKVSAGDVLAEIETDKAVMDLEAFASGVLRKLLVKEGETVPSGSLIAVIGEPDEDIEEAISETSGAGSPEAAEAKAAAKPATAEAKPAPAVPPAKEAPTKEAEPKKAATKAAPVKEAEVEEREEIKASPRARALARERGIELSTLKGSGPGGRIVEQDVLGAKATKTARSRAATEKPLSQMRKAIARTTTSSKAPVPHFYVTSDIDMGEAVRFRQQYKQARAEHPSVTDMILKAVALALQKHPEINVSYAGDVLRQHGRIDLGMAVGLDDGLITPVIRDCESKSLGQIATESKRLAERARKRQLSPEEYTGSTFSVSNLGMYDVDSFIAVLTPPEAAALAVGSIREEPVVSGSRVKLGRRMRVTLSCDHRALDGLQAATFLKEVKRILEHPLELILEK